MKKYTRAQNIKYYAKLPRKRVSVGALFFNNKNQLLIVKPNYKDNWLLVGGSVEKQESPYQGIKREVKEEIGINFKPRPICIEYQLKKNFQSETIYILFYGGVLNQKQINAIKLQKSELEEYKFISPKLAIKVLSKTAGPRIPHCLKAIKNKQIVYLENGKLINNL
ncbi:MAG: NUDIX hydrolase [Patescibacteria group bacterium]